MNPRIIGRRAGGGPRHARAPRVQGARRSTEPRTSARSPRSFGLLVALLVIPTAATLADVADHPLAAHGDPTLVRAVPAAPQEPASDETAPGSGLVATTVQVTAAAGETIWSIAERTGAAPGAIVRHNHTEASPNPGSETSADGDALGSGRTLERPRTVVVPATTERAGPYEPSESRPEPIQADDAPRLVALEPAFDRWADHFGVPRDLLKAIAWVESGWDNTTRSPSGGVGIGRLQPLRAQYLAEHVAGMPLDPRVEVDNIALTAAQLRVLLDETPDVRSAIAAHRQGIIDTRLAGVDPMLDGYVDAVLTARARFA